MSDLPYRQIHLDFHTSPLIDGVGEGFDAAEFAAVLQEARVESINLFAKCHHGMYYYPSKIGTMHPGLRFDLLGAQMEACRGAGIRTCIYTTTAWNEDWADRHPEWLQIDMDGISGHKRPFESGYVSWRNLCLNQPGLREYMRAELAEIYDRYRPAGFWIDITVQFGCVCNLCRAEIRKMGLDPTRIGDVRWHDRLVEIGYMRKLREYLRTIAPAAAVFFNGFTFRMDLGDDLELTSAAKRLYNDFVDVESLPNDMGYPHFSIIANYLNHRPQEITMMNGKFHKAWGDFGSLRNLEALEYECFRGAANGAGCCVGDQLHPTGRIDRTVYGRIGQVYRRLEEIEPWLRGTAKVAQIGIYASNRAMEEENLSSEGAHRMLVETHRLFDFIGYGDDLSRYELVILPDCVPLDQGEAARLQHYLRNGGKALVTGRSALDAGGNGFVLPEMGVEFAGPAAFTPRYVHLTEEEFPGIPPMDYVLYEEGAAVRALPGAEVLAYVTNPYFNRTYDRFCSHRQTPPAGVTGEPCIVRNGGVIYIANPLFRDYAISGCKVHRQIVEACLDRLLERPMLRADLPTTAEVTLRRQGGNLVLHVLNYLIQRKCKELDTIEEKPTLYDRKIQLRSASPPRQVVLIPQGEEIPFGFDHGYIEFSIPRIEGHQMVVAEFGGI